MKRDGGQNLEVGHSVRGQFKWKDCRVRIHSAFFIYMGLWKGQGLRSKNCSQGGVKLFWFLTLYPYQTGSLFPCSVLGVLLKFLLSLTYFQANVNIYNFRLSQRRRMGWQSNSLLMAYPDKTVSQHGGSLQLPPW
ncbi:hypothetical protein V6N11_080487 [Hibiscus sabdariffa]|uniref:Uncharacterized protein n=1 Tax=Hibiscus sabdariffa TaxID=183260 RepID=A0ABR2R7U7_9ROSI